MSGYYITPAGQVLRTVVGESTQGYTPVVVIDPEDRTQIKRLMGLFADALNWGPHNMQRETYMEPLTAALRAFANPTSPAPEEPTGRFAEVENAEGMTYYRSPAGSWRRSSDDLVRDWQAIGAVRVLSEGVQP